MVPRNREQFANWNMDEHGAFISDLPIEMVIVHYVSLPQGMPDYNMDKHNVIAGYNWI